MLVRWGFLKVLSVTVERALFYDDSNTGGEVNAPIVLFSTGGCVGYSKCQIILSI